MDLKKTNAQRMWAVTWAGVEDSVESVWPSEEGAIKRIEALGQLAQRYGAFMAPCVVLPDFDIDG